MMPRTTMIRTTLAATAALLLLSSEAGAWSQETHKRIAKDALQYMNSPAATPDMRRAVNFYAGAAGGLNRAAELIGQAAYDVDDFHDTRLGGWWVGYEHAPLGDLAESLVNYSSYWHFLNLTRGADAHGNDHGGYDYRYHTVDGSLLDVDWYAMVYLYNRDLKSSDFDTTEAHYRQGSSSNRDQHYADFQAMAFQPVDNLGKYWFDQFKSVPTLQSIGFSLHAVGDASQPHHVYNTIANNHSGWEGWVKDYYDAEGLADANAVAGVVPLYDPRTDIRGLITQVGNEAYRHPEPLYSTDYATRVQVAKILIPHAIAANVAVLTKGVNYLHGQGGN